MYENVIKELRANVITKMSALDISLDEIISSYFSRKEIKSLFVKSFLSRKSSSDKINLVKSIVRKENIILDENWTSSFKICNEIRNTTSHNNPILLKDESTLIYPFSFAQSKGFLEVDQTNSIFNEHFEKLEETILTIRYRICVMRDINFGDDTRISIVTAYLRNYKDWFIDIYELIAILENGVEIELDYPDYQYPTYDYEASMKELIVLKLIEYGYIVSEDQVELQLDWYEEAKD